MFNSIIVSRGLTKCCVQIMINGVEVLSLQVDTAKFNNEVVANHPIAKRLLGFVWPVPSKVDALQIVPPQARFLCRGQNADIRLKGIGVDELAQDLALSFRHVSAGHTDFLGVRPLAAGIREDVEKAAFAELSLSLEAWSEVGLQLPGEFFFSLQSHETLVTSAHDSVGKCRKSCRRHRDDLIVPDRK